MRMVCKRKKKNEEKRKKDENKMTSLKQEQKFDFIRFYQNNLQLKKII